MPILLLPMQSANASFQFAISLRSKCGCHIALDSEGEFGQYIPWPSSIQLGTSENRSRREKTADKWPQPCVHLDWNVAIHVIRILHCVKVSADAENAARTSGPCKLQCGTCQKDPRRFGVADWQWLKLELICHDTLARLKS